MTIFSRFFLTNTFLTLSFFAYSQKADTLRNERLFEYTEPTKFKQKKCDRREKKNKKLYEKLYIESKDIDFKTLTKKIIEDVYEYKFDADIILFFYNYSYTTCGNYSSGKFNCESDYDVINPFYHNYDWTFEDIISLSKVLKNKVIIPSEKNFGFSISNKIFDIENIENEKLKKYYEFKIGEANDRELGNKLVQFYYLTENPIYEKIHIQTDYIYNKVLNYKYSTLYYKFKNLPNRKVRVTTLIDSKYYSKIYKYRNKKWK